MLANRRNWLDQLHPNWPYDVWNLRTCFLDGWRLSEGGPVDFCCRTHQGPLPVCCLHHGKHLKSLSRTSNSRNSSKNRSPHSGNRSETAPPAISYHVGKPSKMTGPTSRVTSETCGRFFSTDFDCFRLAQSIQTVFHVLKRTDSKPACKECRWGTHRPVTNVCTAMYRWHHYSYSSLIFL